MAAEFGGDVRIGLDDENGGAVVCFGGGKRALELGNRGDVPRNGPETFGMSREVNFTAVGDTVACGRCNRKDWLSAAAFPREPEAARRK